MSKKELMEDDEKAFLHRSVAELDEANAQMMSESDRSSEALTELQSLYDKKNEFCQGFTNRNVVLHGERNDARSNVKVLEEKLAKMEEDAAANAIAAEEC
jgi:hypothetical protein